MLGVAAIASAGWLFLLVVLLVAPSSPGPRRGGGPGDGTADGPAGDQGGDEPPTVISLLAGKLDRTALGAAPAALAVFAPGRTNIAWSSYRGGWQQLEIETSTTSWPLGRLAMIAIGPG